MMSVVKAQEQRRVPAYVLVGFLGSGKTTVLSQLIEWCVNAGLKPGLIINEFGDISIDGEEVRQVGLQMTELTSGCVCCTASGDMTQALIEMASRPDVDLIFLEATGLADPADMLDELTEFFLWQCVEVGGIISVVDSKRFVELSEDNELARRQVAYADVLVMNKCDLITQEWRDALADTLPILAPYAKIFAAREGLPEEGVEALLVHALAIGRERHQPAPADDHEQQMHVTPAEHSHHDHHDHDEHDHDHAHGQAHESIHTVSFPLDQPLDRNRFEQLLESLPNTVYRAKGFVSFVGKKATFLFQYFPGYIHIRAFPLHDRSLQRGVFIGQHLEKAWLAEQLDACRETTAPTAAQPGNA
ncbi:MAG TPA: GTP-binding protein [Ktedonobacteraceae bacterium]|nr:GTP-binding protein [Ktedonobacteraceae bacterium]